MSVLWAFCPGEGSNPYLFQTAVFIGPSFVIMATISGKSPGTLTLWNWFSPPPPPPHQSRTMIPRENKHFLVYFNIDWGDFYFGGFSRIVTVMLSFWRLRGFQAILALAFQLLLPLMLGALFPLYRLLFHSPITDPFWKAGSLRGRREGDVRRDLIKHSHSFNTITVLLG